MLIGGAPDRANDVWALDAARGQWTCLEKRRPDADGQSCPTGFQSRDKPCAL